MGSLFSTGNVQTKRPNYSSPIQNGRIDPIKLSRMHRSMKEQTNELNAFIETFVDSINKEQAPEPVEIHTIEQMNQYYQDLKNNLASLHDVLQYIGQHYTREMSEDELNAIVAQGELDVDQETVQTFREAVSQQQRAPIVNHLAVGEANSFLTDILETTEEQLNYAKASTDEGVWEKFCDEGDMKLFSRKDYQSDGNMCAPPLKAIHSIKGVTAKECIDYFFKPEHKMEWDIAIQDMEIVEQVQPNIIIFHLNHKWIPPVARRESLFWSHLCDVSYTKYKDSNAFDAYAVCNITFNRDDVQLFHKSNVRAGARVIMLCQTVIEKQKTNPKISRDNVRCNIIYMAQLSSGGYVPIAPMEALYRREFPRFLKNFTEKIQNKTQGKPLRLEKPTGNVSS
uniref:START domain-containing protein n=1 Tax=Acrobeloides nanus TaxID=290746 RepID=A0A914DYQ1_9BILA